jgi:hypothetical protein
MPRITMPFGCHKGQLLSSVPVSYLCWMLTECPSLTPYMRNAAVAELGIRAGHHGKHAGDGILGPDGRPLLRQAGNFLIELAAEIAEEMLRRGEDTLRGCGRSRPAAEGHAAVDRVLRQWWKVGAPQERLSFLNWLKRHAAAPRPPGGAAACPAGATSPAAATPGPAGGEIICPGAKEGHP